MRQPEHRELKICRILLPLIAALAWVTACDRATEHRPSSPLPSVIANINNSISAPAVNGETQFQVKSEIPIEVTVQLLKFDKTPLNDSITIKNLTVEGYFRDKTNSQIQIPVEIIAQRGVLRKGNQMAVLSMIVNMPAEERRKRADANFEETLSMARSSGKMGGHLIHEISLNKQKFVSEWEKSFFDSQPGNYSLKVVCHLPLNSPWKGEKIASQLIPITVLNKAD